MTLENTLRQHLNNSEPGGFHLEADGWSVTVAAEKKDSLSCALNMLALEKAEPISTELYAWAKRVADHATGLLEPLRLIEADAKVGKAVLRSDKPTQRDGKALYYELVLNRTDRTSATLRRYAGQTTEPREALAFVLTHDAIIKLVNDLVR